ncbi:MAG: hypothetical protein JKY54_09825 [Flavobacteriales bacterium]|nr:hypothetical protein [Flavobacteriales bacterium]
MFRFIHIIICFFLFSPYVAQITIKDSTLQYEIQLPKNWHVSNSGLGEVTMTSPPEDVLDVFLENISVSVIPKGITLEEHNERHIRSAYKDDVGFRGFRLLEFKLINIHGKRATINHERFHDGRKMLDIYLATIEGDYFFYQIICASLSGRFDEHKANFNKVIRTFKINESILNQQTVNLIAKRLGIPLINIPKVPERPDN